MTPSLTLGFDCQFSDLYHREGLEKIDGHFQAYLVEVDPDLAHAYTNARQQSTIDQGTTDNSSLLIALAPLLEDFIGQLFAISPDLFRLQQAHQILAPLYSTKRLFVQRQAIRRFREADLALLDPQKIRDDLAKIMGFDDKKPFDELFFAQQVTTWMADEQTFASSLEIAAKYAAWATLTPAGQQQHHHHVLFHVPHKIDPLHLLPAATDQTDSDKTVRCTLPNQYRHRDGFSLTDPGLSRIQALDEATYCIVCHHQGKDSCSKGMKVKTTALSNNPADKFMKNSLGVTLSGCPLEEKISEMHAVKTQGYTLGALAIITIDNPMVAATGHRICNDCMKSCIYQKQEPVNIPGVETQILTDVLSLPWGFEIYSLLTRWNPLNFTRPLPKADSGYKVLVVGMGPAGFTLSHHLMNDGHTVVGIDGLKIEPLDDHLIAKDGGFIPIHNLSMIREDLNDRITGGFGGVAEYGITVRWDKNFLKIIRLLLQRRAQFALYDGVRFGGTLTIDQAFDFGFDHIALCMGAGSPTLIPLENGLAMGVRQASDFLMALQLTGAAKTDSVANLQVRLPAVVIGGGLTAIDTATEIMAYYPVQVEKFWRRYQILAEEQGAEALRALWSPAEWAIAETFLNHGQAVVEERTKAQSEGRVPYFIPLLQQWGGVTLAYRRDLTMAPSYTLNHEEITKALEEGIYILDHATPLRVEIDEGGQATGLTISHHQTIKTLPAHAIFVAAGTKPNINLIHDDPLNVVIDGKTFQALDESGQPVQPERLSKPADVHVLMQKRPNGQAISFFGDLHPSFAGNVVKAMGSAKQGYPIVSRILQQMKATPVTGASLMNFLDANLRPVVHAVNRLTPTILEIVIKAPLAAAAFRPGQFYRLQNYETYAPFVHGTRLAMEGLALTGAKADVKAGLLSTIVLEMGGSSSLCQLLKPGEPLVLMGPTGAPTETYPHETVLLAGGGLGNAVLFSIGQELRAKGSRVIYFAAYKNAQDRYKTEEIEAAADVVIWCCDQSPGFIPTRPQDFTFIGNIVAAIKAYGDGQLGAVPISLQTVDRLIAIGSDRMMAAVASARKTILAPFLNPNHQAFASINAPMQCMMKEICAQCLQRQVDPVTGEEKIVYTCANQDQPLDWVDFKGLSERLQQNSVQEKLTQLWINHCLKNKLISLRIGNKILVSKE